MTSPELRKKTVMAGPALDAPGGMSAVVFAYKEGGLFRAQNVVYLTTYERPGKLVQLRVFSKALLTFLGMLLVGDVGLLHVHSASRGSFWRKSILCALARTFNVPYIFHVHSGEFPVFVTQECGPLKQWWILRTLGGAFRVVALTTHWQQELSSLATQAHVVAIGNPINPSVLATGHRSAVKSVLFLGRLREKKGVFDLIAAIPAVLKHFPNVLFTIAGDGDLTSATAKSEQLGVTSHVNLPGWVDGPSKDSLLAQADVLVLPSYFEGLPICVLEAMAAKVPVVGSTVGGIPEVLEWGKCGALVAPGDVDGLATALVAKLCGGTDVEAATERAHTRVIELYSLPKIMAQLSDIYGAARHDGPVSP